MILHISCLYYHLGYDDNHFGYQQILLKQKLAHNIDLYKKPCFKQYAYNYTRSRVHLYIAIRRILYKRFHHFVYASSV
jgi:hypothetical protein